MSAGARSHRRGGRVALALVLGLVASAVVGVSVSAEPDEVVAGATVTARAVRAGDQTQIIPPPAPATARYRVTISLNWTSVTHPNTVPPNAHISPPVYVSHSTPGALFATGTLASPGIESMAETGGTSTLRAELAANPAVTGVELTDGIFDAGTRSEELTLTQSADLISLVTMLAPSPDWFVGVRDQDLFVNGRWVESIAAPLGNYDAGTDSGSGFTSGNVDTQPPVPISGPVDAAFGAAVAENAFGSVRIQRIG